MDVKSASWCSLFPAVRELLLLANNYSGVFLNTDSVRFLFILLIGCVLLYGPDSLGGGLQCVSVVTKRQWLGGRGDMAFIFKPSFFICAEFVYETC